jgi:hypothetical protein
MRTYTIILLLILAIPLSAFTQQITWLRDRLKNADTVLLVSHEDTQGVVIMDSTGKRKLRQKLLVAGRPNHSIIKEQNVLTGADLDTLIKILARPYSDRQYETSKCFMPHHAIFIIRQGKTSFIEICFGCRGIDTSKDLEKLYAFDERKWTELENYFIKLGFKYQLTEE